MIQIDDLAVEGGTYAVQVALYRDATTPLGITALTWSLTDLAGAPINSRLRQAAAASDLVTIVLSGDDLAVPEGRDVRRVLTLEGTFDDPVLGNGQPLRLQIGFTVENTALAPAEG